MTSDQDRESGTEVRICARCGHPEDQHTLIEVDGDTEAHTMCTACGSPCDFHPRPLDE
jgi:ribosomal protein L37E